MIIIKDRIKDCLFPAFTTAAVPCMLCAVFRWVLTLLRSPLLQGITFELLLHFECARQLYLWSVLLDSVCSIYTPTEYM